jgi:hypothetical protein
MINQIQNYLGDTSIEDFESIKEIKKYFEKSNMEAMFGCLSESEIIEAEKARDFVIEKWKAIPSHFIVKVSNAKTPLSCWGDYCHIAILECEHWQYEPSMISEHALGVIRIVEYWGNLNVGKTEKCAFRRAYSDAEDMCRILNENR